MIARAYERSRPRKPERPELPTEFASLASSPLAICIADHADRVMFSFTGRTRDSDLLSKPERRTRGTFICCNKLRALSPLRRVQSV